MSKPKKNAPPPLRPSLQPIRLPLPPALPLPQKNSNASDLFGAEPLSPFALVNEP